MCRARLSSRMTCSRSQASWPPVRPRVVPWGLRRRAAVGHGAVRARLLGGRQNRPDCGPCRRRRRHRRRDLAAQRRCSLLAASGLAAEAPVLPCGRTWHHTSSWPRLAGRVHACGSCVRLNSGDRQRSKGGASFLQRTAHKHMRGGMGGSGMGGPHACSVCPDVVPCVPRCRVLCVRRRALCAPTHGGAHARLGRSRHGGRAGSPSPANAGPSS